MNHTYRLVWNEATQSYVPVAESTRARKKNGGCKRLGAVIALAALGTVSSAFAGPSGGEVVAGQASITQDGTTTTITQQSDTASLNWQQFDIAANETVQFVQPSASSVALNRVIGSDASEIYGQLRSNGQVFLINPNGVLFGRTAQVDVGGLVASTLNISDEHFLAGNYRFTGSTPAGIVNEGTITAADGGSIALLGGQVSNQGTISARLGTVALAAGEAISLDFSGQQLMNVRVDADTFNALVQNHHLIQADGGNVIMTAAARDALLGTVVNNTGVIQARTVEERDGQILLLGGFEGGTVKVGGTLDASAPSGGNGGFIETSGAHVKVADDARITTSAPQGSAGTWLIDPPDFTIAATGGDISGAALGANLENGNVSILSSQGTANVAGNGDIHINDAITWSSGTTLTLTAARDVNVNEAITNTGSPANGGVTLRADSAGACVAGASNCGTINFAGAGHITAATTNLYYNPTGSNAAADANGIGPSYATQTDYSANVTGTLNAFMLVNDVNQLQAVNTNLTGSYALGRNIDARATSGWNDGAGFDPLGDFSSSTNFSGRFDGVGHGISGLFINRPSTDGVGLFALTNSATIRNVDLIGGSMTGRGRVGALVGEHQAGDVSNVTSSVRITGDMDYVGGVFGYQSGSVTDVHSTGQVTGLGFLGGLTGQNSGTISISSATGAVNGSANSVGGLVGRNEGSITDAYAVGAVSGASRVGGLVGANPGTVANTYASGAVTGTTDTGGLVGTNDGTGSVTFSYFDYQTTGQPNVSDARGTPRATSGFALASLFPANRWDFKNTWVMILETARPFLRSEYSTTIVNAHQLQLIPMAAADPNRPPQYVLGADIDLSEVSRASGLWNTTRGFVPIGNRGVSQTSLGEFVGTFDGAGHTITGLFMDRTSSSRSSSFVGLFGTNAFGSTIQHVGLIDGSVRGNQMVGSLVGLNNGTVRNVYSTASVTGTDQVGGLAGSNNGGAIISNAYATGAVTGDNTVGGLIGSNSGAVTNVYATGTLSGQNEVGGLLGFNNGGGGSVLSYGYATGLVTGTSNVGGLVGRNINSSNIVSSFWDTQTSGQAASSGGIGKTSAEMRDASTFSAWNISSSGGSNAVWRIYDGHTGPLLRNFMTAATVAVDDVSTTYNGSAQTVGINFNAGSANPSLIFTGNTSFRNVGSYSLGSSLYSNQLGYDISFTGGALNIARANLTLSSNDVVKTYDGTTAANGTATAVGGTSLLGTDSLSGGTFAFTEKNAGTGKTVTVGGVTINDGNGGNNYDVSYIDNTTSTIDKANLTLAANSGTKTYDGTTSSNSGATASGLAMGDIVGATAAYDSKDVMGTNGSTLLVANYTITGSDGLNASGNYNVSTTTAAGTITPRSLTYTTAAADKVYDGTTAATVTLSGLTGLVGSETLGVSGTGTFDSKDVATANTVTVNTATLTDGSNGGLASNYSIAADGTAAARITPKALGYTVTAPDKEYDGTTAASVTLNLADLVGNETLGVIGTGTFNSKDVATANRVTVNTANLTDGSNGGLASNYSIAGGGSRAARITPKALNYTATALDKVYDGTTAATLSLSGLQGLVGNETLGLSGTGSFNTKDVATANTVNISASLTNGTNGGLASNYSIAANKTAPANITAKSLTYTATAANKEYDGTTAATVTLSGLTGLVGDETFDVIGTGTFNSKDVATANTVTVDSVSLANGTNGGLASNYSIAHGGTAAANITARSLTYTTAAADKVYDGTTAATVTLSELTGLVGNETFDVIGTGSFNSKDVATANTVTVDSVSLANGSNGGLASNYSIASGGTAAANITARSLTYTTAAADNVYDGTTAATVTLSGLTGLVGNETFDVIGTGTFNSKDVATANTVTVDAVSLANGTNGGLASNYSIAAGGTAAANITARSLTYTTTAADKVYDGTTAATVTLSGLSGLVGNETFDVSGTGTFNSKDVATANTVTVDSVSLANGSNGGLASNYSIASGGTAAANITARSLTYTTTASDKVYDGTTAATVTLSGITGLVGNEMFDVSGTGTFNSKDVATANTVTVDAVSLANGSNGGLASNYSIASGGTAAANITARSLTYTTAAADKVYDGTTAATVTLSGLSGLVGNETFDVSGTGTFNSKDVATANTVTVNSVSLANGSNGGLASNYSIAAGGTAVANITARSLTYTTTATDKVYDGTTTARVTLSGLTGLVGTETLGVSGIGTFNSKDVATANTVTVDSVSLANGTNGGLASNYSIAAGGTAAANITARSLTYTTAAADKVYDGTTAATVTLSGLTGLVGNETLGVSGTGTFNSKDVTTANAVTIDSVGLADGTNGGLASNYSIEAGGTAAANITARSLTYTTTATDKVYDGTIAATVTLSGLTGLIGNETLGVIGTGTFNSKDVATANTVTVNTATLTNGTNGGLASNYSIAAGGTAAANITARSLTYTTTAADKVYDGTTAATVTLSGLTGLIGTETLGITGTGTFNSKDVATANTVTVNTATLTNGSNGGLASNYRVAAGGTASAHITQAALTIAADNQTRPINTPNPSLTATYTGFVPGESAATLTTQPTLSTTADLTSAQGSYAIDVSGAVDPNYTFTYVPGTLIVTNSIPLLDYLGVLSYADDIDSAYRDEQDERRNGDRFARNHRLLQIRNQGIKLPPGVK